MNTGGYGASERDELFQPGRRLLVDHVKEFQQPVDEAQLLLRVALDGQRPSYGISKVPSEYVWCLRRVHGRVPGG
jgi:hypothetical protein